MLPKTPIDIDKLSDENIDREMLRASIISELDASSLYEQFASTTSNKQIQKIMREIAKEKKTHIAEFRAILLRLDQEQMENEKNEAQKLAGIEGE